MQQWNKGVNKSINIIVICVEFMHPVEQSKSGKVSLICRSCIKAEEKTFNLIKVGISFLSYMFVKLPECLEFFSSISVLLDKITPFTPFPCQKEKITEETISSSTKKLKLYQQEHKLFYYCILSNFYLLEPYTKEVRD